MGNLPAVEVLLATYNGACFLKEQVDSILGQDYGNIRILARDDGSSDKTVQILEQYSQRFPDRFRVMPSGPSTGSPKNNFLILMKAATADYVCFCDQDDVWLPDKVSRTKQNMDRLQQRWGEKVPLLVFTDLHLTDDKLEIVHDSFWAYMSIDPERIYRLPQLMVQSVVTGCTVMLNRALLELALRMPEDAYMHDRWVSWLASFMGKVGIERTQTVYYRQHDRNAVGTGSDIRGDNRERSQRSLWQKIRQPRIAPAHVIRWDISQRQARAFLREHREELPPKKLALVRGFLRCQTSRNRLTRIATFIRYRFFYVGVKANVALIIHLWKMKPDKNQAG